MKNVFWLIVILVLAPTLGLKIINVAVEVFLFMLQGIVTLAEVIRNALL